MTGDSRIEARLHQVGIAVSDPEAALAWYCQHLGAQRSARDACQFQVGSISARFVDAQATPSSGAAIDHLGVSFSDLDRQFTVLQSAGAHVVVRSGTCPVAAMR